MMNAVTVHNQLRLSSSPTIQPSGPTPDHIVPFYSTPALASTMETTPSAQSQAAAADAPMPMIQRAATTLAPTTTSPKPNPQLRLQQLLESGRLAPSPPSSPPAHERDPAPLPVLGDTPAHPQKRRRSTHLTSPGRRKRRRARPEPNLAALAEQKPDFLPDAMHYNVCVSSRNPSDISLENDHDLHILISFPTRQMAHDWIMKHRLELARHYLRDPKLTEQELTSMRTQEGNAADAYYLGEGCSMEILSVPHFKHFSHTPGPDVLGVAFSDHFATNDQEEEHEENIKRLSQQEQQEQQEEGEGEGHQGVVEAESKKDRMDEKMADAAAASSSTTKKGGKDATGGKNEKEQASIGATSPQP